MRKIAAALVALLFSCAALGAPTATTSLPAASTLTGSETAVINQSSHTKIANISDIKTYVQTSPTVTASSLLFNSSASLTDGKYWRQTVTESTDHTLGYLSLRSAPDALSDTSNNDFLRVYRRDTSDNCGNATLSPAYPCQIQFMTGIAGGNLSAIFGPLNIATIAGPTDQGYRFRCQMDDSCGFLMGSHSASLTKAYPWFFLYDGSGTTAKTGYMIEVLNTEATAAASASRAPQCTGLSLPYTCIASAGTTYYQLADAQNSNRGLTGGTTYMTVTKTASLAPVTMTLGDVSGGTITLNANTTLSGTSTHTGAATFNSSVIVSSGITQPAAATSTSTGSNLSIASGAGGSTSGASGSITITPPPPTEGIGAATTIKGGAAGTSGSTNHNGGAINAQGGNATVAGAGGAASLKGGQGGTTGPGGPTTVSGGQGGSSGGTGGDLSMQGGNGNATGSAGTGGAANLYGGSGATAGNVFIGPGAGSSTKGSVQITDSGLNTFAFFDDALNTVIAGKASPATSDTNGFLYIPKVAGAQTGTPANTSGSYATAVPVRYDSTNDTLSVYNGAWKKFYPSLGSATSGSLGGSSLAAGVCASTPVTLTGATTSMNAVASPATYPGDGMYWSSVVTSANTVTVRVCNGTGATNTPTASTYTVRVVQ